MRFVRDWRVVLGITDVLAPRCPLAVLAHLRQREMHEQLVGRGAVPVQHAGWDVDHIAWMERVCRLSLEADAAGPAQAVEGLPHGMRVPGGASARGKGVNQTADTRRRVGGNEQFLEHDASEGLGGTPPGGALSGTDDSGLDGHGFLLFAM